MCVEPALENIGWNGGPVILLNGAAIEVREHTLFRFCNSYDLAVVGTDLVFRSQ